MPTLTSIRQDEAFGKTIHSMLSTSQELAVMRIQLVKDSARTIEQTMNGVTGIFQDVRRAQYQEIARLMNTSQTKKTVDTEIKQPIHRVAVLLSDHHHFSGKLHKDVFAAFEKELTARPTDAMIVGATGQRFAKQSPFFQSHPFEYMEIDLESATPETMAALVEKIAAYEEVTVFASLYQNLMSQTPTVVDATGLRFLENTTETLDNKNETVPTPHFLFEPSLPELLQYFKQEIARFLIELSIDSSRIAHLGSRIQTLEQAVDNVSQNLTLIEQKERRLKKLQNNRKRQQRIAGIAMLWG